MNKVCIAISFIVLAFTAQAQNKWSVETSQPQAKKVTFNVNEGTWMNLDVSPNGQNIVFDLLGDIYTIPVKGGKATLLAGGRAYDVQPRYSPDGKQISYTSDKDGGDNIW
jgi:Tol biopolymer transport system component